MEQEALGEEATLSAFLEEVALVADIDTVNKDDNRVLLMTLHSAKGLEFANVYLSGLEDGIFPLCLPLRHGRGDFPELYVDQRFRP